MPDNPAERHAGLMRCRTYSNVDTFAANPVLTDDPVGKFAAIVANTMLQPFSNAAHAVGNECRQWNGSATPPTAHDNSACPEFTTWTVASFYHKYEVLSAAVSVRVYNRSDFNIECGVTAVHSVDNGTGTPAAYTVRNMREWPNTVRKRLRPKSDDKSSSTCVLKIAKSTAEMVANTNIEDAAELKGVVVAGPTNPPKVWYFYIWMIPIENSGHAELTDVPDTSNLYFEVILDQNVILTHPFHTTRDVTN